MDQDEIKAGLLSLEPTHPFYRAVLALLDSDIESEQATATAPGLNGDTRQFVAGRLAHAIDIRRAVEGVVNEARQELAAAQARADRQQRQREEAE